MKRVYLIWIIIISVALNIAIIASFLYQRYQYDESTLEEVEKIEIPNSRLGRFFRAELDLSPQQHQKFRTYRHQFHIDASKLTQEMQQKRNEMMRELQNENSDTIKLHRLAKELGNLHEQLKHTTFTYYLNLKEQCNKEQQKRLFTIFYNLSNASPDMETPCPPKK